MSTIFLFSKENRITFLFWLMSQDFISILGNDVLKNNHHSP